MLPPVNTKVTLDSNWRWIHIKGDYQNCYEGAEWDNNFCKMHKEQKAKAQWSRR